MLLEVVAGMSDSEQDGCESFIGAAVTDRPHEMLGVITMELLQSVRPEDVQLSGHTVAVQ